MFNPLIFVIWLLAILAGNTVSAGEAGEFNQLLQGIKGLQPRLFQDELLRAEQAFRFEATVKDPYTLNVRWLIADGYYLYREKFALTVKAPDTVQLDSYQLPRGERHHDEAFGDVEIFHQEVALDVPLRRLDRQAATLTLHTKYQGCADRGVCYPPIETTITLPLPVADDRQSPPVLPPAKAVALSEQDRIVNALHQDSLGLTLASFFGFGLLLAFTPCIFPMIPILSGIIVGHGSEITHRKAFLLSASYVLASALMYTSFGILAALFGANLQAALQQVWVIVAFSMIFVVLALSMFGFYHLEVPKSMQAWLHRSSDKHRDGSYLGAAIMGALSSLIVGPCVAAPLAAALIYIGQTGDVGLGASALFAMGLGMGMPLLLVGASAGKLLPKAGDWLNSTKAVFGVIMLAMAVWMMERVLPVALSMLLWAMLLIIPAIYLNAIEPLPAAASGWRKLWKGLGVIMLVLGVLQLIGLSAGNGNPLQPLAGLVPGRAEAKPSDRLAFQRIRSLAELEEKIRQAAANRQWLMLDFYADWCIACKEMEAYTFTNAAVKQRLANFMLIQADVTANNDDDKALLQRFKLIGPPGIVFFGPDRQERVASRVIGYQDAATFLQTLQQL